ncbi:MAG: hypothetical protein N3F03_08285 [Ignavibacteria bacterium]|nr:hypothetical protein [Ignavibacteria bacterium]
MVVSELNLKQKINDVKNYLDKEGKPVKLKKISHLFFEKEELPIQFDYQDYGIELLNFYEIIRKPTYSKINLEHIKESYLISQDVFKKAIVDIFNCVFLTRKVYVFSYSDKTLDFIQKQFKNLFFSKEPRMLELCDIDFLNKVFRILVTENHFIIDKVRKSNELHFCLYKEDYKSYIIAKHIASLVRNSNKLHLDNIPLLLKLHFGLEIDDLSLIKNALIENSERFHIDENNYISLTDDIEFLKKYFRENLTPWDEALKLYYDAGIYAVIFTGKEFPLKEASEYVQTRPYIYIGHTSGSLSDEIYEPFLMDLGKCNELLKYLKAILTEEQKTKEIEVLSWLKENTKISFYEEKTMIDYQVYLNLINEFSPIFNVFKNPGNLFSYTLEKKYENFLEKIRK